MLAFLDFRERGHEPPGSVGGIGLAQDEPLEEMVAQVVRFRVDGRHDRDAAAAVQRDRLAPASLDQEGFLTLARWAGDLLQTRLVIVRRGPLMEESSEMFSFHRAMSVSHRVRRSRSTLMCHR